jgi:hypothetical protein
MIMILLLASVLCCMALIKNANALEVDLEEDEYFVSVDPDDPDQGFLEVRGEVDPGDLGLGESLSVSLSVVVHEAKDGQPTGRTWHAEISYDDSSIGTGAKIFRRGDGPESFTVTMDPSEFDPERDEGIPVPEGLTDDYEGRMIVTVTYTGTGAPSGDTTVQARIFPELYHLINLSTPDDPVEMEAGDRLIYSLSIKNAGNMEESVIIEVPVLEELELLDFQTELDTDFIELLMPGERISINLTIKAPLEITRDDSFRLLIRAYTVAEDPRTLEPASEKQIEIDLDIKKSKIEKPDPGTDDDDDQDDDDDDPFNPNPNPGTDPITSDENTEPWMVVLAIGFIVVIVLVLALFFFRRGGDEEDDDQIEDAHASNFRI